MLRVNWDIHNLFVPAFATIFLVDIHLLFGLTLLCFLITNFDSRSIAQHTVAQLASSGDTVLGQFQCQPMSYMSDMTCLEQYMAISISVQYHHRVSWSPVLPIFSRTILMGRGITLRWAIGSPIWRWPIKNVGNDHGLTVKNVDMYGDGSAMRVLEWEWHGMTRIQTKHNQIPPATLSCDVTTMAPGVIHGHLSRWFMS